MWVSQDKGQAHAGNVSSFATSSSQHQLPIQAALLSIPEPPLFTISCPSPTPAQPQNRGAKRWIILLTHSSWGPEIEETTFCFKTLNDADYNDSKVTFLGTKHRLSDTMKFYSKEFGVNMSHLLLGKTLEDDTILMVICSQWNLVGFFPAPLMSRAASLN